MSKVIAKFHWDCGRMGDVDGLFIADKSKLESANGEHVYFGEILGKHSEVYGDLDESAITILTEDQDFIAKFIEIMGDGTISGYNPLEYLSDEEDEEDKEEEDEQ